MERINRILGLLGVKRSVDAADPLLDGLLKDWRASERIAAPSRGGLSPGRRARILAEVESGDREMPAMQSLFLPGRRLAVAAALPALVLALALGLVPDPGGDASGSIEPQGRFTQVVKRGDEVVFLIANGGSAHRVHKSSNVNALGSGPAFAVASGSFRDRLDSESGLVFYRID